IPPAPRGVPQIQVTFDIDADGILSVSAKDLGTTREAMVRVQPTSGLSEQQLERLAEEASAKKAEDVHRRELVELRNRAEALVYTCRRSLEVYGASLSDVDRQDIEHDTQRLEALLKVESAAEPLRTAIAALENSSHQIYEAMLAGG